MIGRKFTTVLLLLVATSCYLWSATSFEKDFENGEEIPIHVLKMKSTRALVALDYYRLPFCAHPTGPKLVETLSNSDRVENSPYFLKMKTDMYCEHVCISNLGRSPRKGSISNKLERAIRKDYRSNWMVDTLVPSTFFKKGLSSVRTTSNPVGFVDSHDMQAYAYNHLNIEVTYRPVKGLSSSTKKYRIVDFVIEPISIQYDFEPILTKEAVDGKYLPQVAKINLPIASCNLHSNSTLIHTDNEMVAAPQQASGNALFTYDVLWKEETKLSWVDRWAFDSTSFGASSSAGGNYMGTLVIFGVVIAAVVILTSKSDRKRYNRVNADEEDEAALANDGNSI